VASVWGIAEVESITGTSGITEYDFGAPAVPDQNTPPDHEFDTHEDTRRAYAAQEQMAHFFATGEILNFCDGACFCADDACSAPAE
jgi:hypothetical protein